MPVLNDLLITSRVQSISKKPLYIVCLMIMFWALYEGVINYMTPLVITQSGFSKTMMGFIIGTSSIAGAIFDIIICKVFKNTYYKRLFMIMFLLCLFYPLLLSQANTLILFLIAMAIWGIYFDLKNIANLDFIGRYTEKTQHANSFGLIQIFQSVGLLISPILVSLLIVDDINNTPFILASVFLFVAIIFFVVLSYVSKKRGLHETIRHHIPRRTFKEELLTLKKIGHIIFPVLILTLFLNVIDAFFWTIGPLFAESLSEIHPFAGFFLFAYTLPPLIVGWFVGSFTHKYGKKRVAFSSLLLGSLLLTFMVVLQNPFIILLLTFLASLCITTSLPSINGAYADYISETPAYKEDIEGQQDFFTNIGYVIGPMMAGFLADTLGNAGAFSMLGVMGLIIASILLAHTPKSINVMKELHR